MPGCILAALLAAASPTGGEGPRVDPRIFAGKAAGERATFLVALAPKADLSGAAAIADRGERRRFVYEALKATAEAAQVPLRERLDRDGIRYRSHFLVDMLEVEGDAALAAELAARADVASVAANRAAPLRLPEPVPGTVSPRTSADIVQPNILKIRAPEIWVRGHSGEGIVVGVADSGFQWDHPALVGAYRGSAASHDYAWHDAVHDAAVDNPCGSDAPAPCDDAGHGTGTAGLALGDGGPGNQIGVAPGATLIGCRNMDRGAGTPARYTECFEWLLAPTDASGNNPRPDLGADVVNNSWSCPAAEGCADVNVLQTAVDNLRAAGIAVVFAAGNGGSAAGAQASCFTIAEPPAIYGSAITVGATWLSDALASFSSVGPVAVDGSNRLKPDLTAPGVGLRTSVPFNGYSNSFSGTSAATPHVTGAIALLWSAVPGLAGDVDRTEAALEQGAAALRENVTCGDYSGENVPNPLFGWGRLDVEGAYERLLPPRAEPVVDVPRPPAPRRVAPRR